MENLRTLLAAKLEKAPAIIQQAAKTTRNSVKAQSKPKPIETATAVATFADPATSSKGAHRRVPDSSTSKANLAALDDLSRPFHELASAGAEFTRTMRIYQYKHDGCGFVLNELGHDIRVPEELSQAWRTMRTSLNRLRWILRAISHIDKPANKNNDAMQRLRPFAEEEAVGHIKLAVEYVEFYMRPYEGALGCLLSTMRAWEDGGVNGEAKWARLRDAMMRTDDGDATRLRKQKG